MVVSTIPIKEIKNEQTEPFRCHYIQVRQILFGKYNSFVDRGQVNFAVERTAIKSPPSTVTRTLSSASLNRHDCPILLADPLLFTYSLKRNHSWTEQLKDTARRVLCFCFIEINPYAIFVA